jgi:spindle assembly abnormal protein 6
MESEHHAAQVGLRSTIETITVQNAELDKQVCVLIDTKYKLDSRLSDVSSRASNAERELQLAREEVARLQNISAELNKVSG